MKLMHKALVLAAMTFAVSGQALAQTTFPTDTMAVTATVTANCLEVTATDIDFQEVAQGEDGEGAGTVTANCGQDTAYIIAIEGGANAVEGVRNLKTAEGAHLLPYSLKSASGDDLGTDYIGEEGGIVYTATTPANGLVLEGIGEGNGADEVFTINAAITGEDSLDAPAGVYTDSVLVVVAF